MSKLIAPVIKQDDERRMVFGPVLVPDEADSDGDQVTAEKIEEVAHKFMEDYGNIDLQHSLNNVGKTVESYIAPVDLEYEGVQVPKGSWMMGVRINDDDSWQSVKDGNLTGFSIMGIPKAAAKSKGVNKNEALKRTTLNDLGDEWTVNAVSLVDEPAVPKAKWVAIKSKSKKANEPSITNETIQKAINGSMEHRKRLVRSHVYATFDTGSTDSFVHSTLDDSVIIDIEDFANGQSHMVQVGYDIDDSGNVNFTSDPQPVRIEENIVPVEGGSPPRVLFSENDGESQVNLSQGEAVIPLSADKQAEEAITEAEKAIQEHENKRSQKSVIEKIADIFNLKSVSQKAGRSISNENYQRLSEVKERVDDMYSRAEVERTDNSNSSVSGVIENLTKGDGSMEKEDVQAIVKEEMSGINDQLKELVDAYKAEKNQGDEGEQEGENGDGDDGDSSQKSDGDESDDDSVSNEEHDALLKELESLKKHRPMSQRIAGQDNMEDGKDAQKSKGTGRNAFGMKVSQ